MTATRRIASFYPDAVHSPPQELSLMRVFRSADYKKRDEFAAIRAVLTASHGRLAAALSEALPATPLSAMIGRLVTVWPSLLVAWLVTGCSLAPSSTVTTNSGPDGTLVSGPGPTSPSRLRLVPSPEIPAALQGCWDAEAITDPEEPGGPHRLVITATTITETDSGPPRIATPEFVERVTATSIEGRFSAPPERAGGAPVTIATSLMLEDSAGHVSTDTLRRAEGDAGSYFYKRCLP